MARAWRCLEAGCDAVIIAPDDEQLVAAVNRHVGEVQHDADGRDALHLLDRRVFRGSAQPPVRARFPAIGTHELVVGAEAVAFAVHDLRTADAVVA